MRVLIQCLLGKRLFLKNTDAKNQIILIFFADRPTQVFFAVLPIDQKINLVLPNKK